VLYSETLKSGSDPTITTKVGSRGKTKWNTLFRLSAYGFSILINLLAIPFIFRSLGPEAFGVVGVINTILSFMSISTISITSTVGRNLTIAVEKGDIDVANKEISTTVYGTLILFGIAFLPLCALCLYIDRLVIMPVELVLGARVLFLLAIISFGFNALAGVFGASMFARNRLDLFSVAALARTICFVTVIYAIFIFFDASLITYGVALLCGTVFLFGLHFRFHKHLLPTIKISLQHFNRSILVGIFSLGGWMVINQIGALLFLQTDLIVANRILGAAAAGQLAAISVISVQLRALATLFAGLFAPNQVALSTQVDQLRFGKYLMRSIRLTTLFMAVLVGVFCGSAREVLSIWLGGDFAFLAPVAILLTFYLIPTLGVMPCWNAIMAIGKVKWPAVVTIAMGIGNVILSVILAGMAGMGLKGIALAGCIMLSLRNMIFVPWYMSRVCDIETGDFLRELFIGMIAGGTIFLISISVSKIVRPESMIMLVLSILLATGIGGLLFLPIVLHTLKKANE
jgi:membrane protein EpsK